MPIPGVLIDDPDYEQVADLARYLARGDRRRPQPPQQLFRETLDEVREHLERGCWRCWPPHKQETAVAVAQRVAWAVLYPAEGRVAW